MASSSLAVPLSRLPSRLFELCRPDLALPEPPKYKAEVGLGPGPIERHALACPFLQRLAVGRDRVFELHSPALSLPKLPKCKAQIVLGPGPIERRLLSGSQLEQPLTPLDRRKQSTVVTELGSLLEEGTCLLF
jgi:hypothetical protein